MRKGLFISFEGSEGCGKTTQTRLLYQRLSESGFNTTLVREPGGTNLGHAVRNMLLNSVDLNILPRSELLLFAASRAQIVDAVIKPQLESGGLIVCDRYVDSTVAYQGYGRGLSLENIHWINNFATASLVPDLTILLDIDVEVGLQRRSAIAEDMNNMDKESLDFHQRVSAGYRLQAYNNVDGRWRSVDAAQPVETVADEVWRVVSNYLN